MSLTIEHIATLADVSRSTVSRVLNNHPSVRPTVRERHPSNNSRNQPSSDEAQSGSIQ